MAMEAMAMMIRTGSLGDVEYVYSDLPNTLQDADYDEDFDFGYEWWQLHQQPVDYVYSDTSGYTLQNANYDPNFDFGYEWWQLHQQPVDYVYSDTSGYKLPDTGSQTSAGPRTSGGAWQTAGAQSPLTGQKMPSIMQRQPVQQSSSGGMLMLLGAIGLGLYFALG
jgi:hypothetical protein